MKQFLKFLAKIKSFWKFYQNYGYDGEKVGFDVSKRLNERHILFCKRILKMLGVDEIGKQ